MAQNSLWGDLLPPWVQSVSALPAHLGGGEERGRCYRRQLAQERFPFLPRPVATFCAVSAVESCSVSSPLQTRHVEGRIIPFPHTINSKIPWPQQVKQSLNLYLALAHSVMWKGARCFVSGDAAQIGDRLQFLQLKTGRWGLWLLGRAVQSHSRVANPSIAAEMGLQYKDNCQHFTAVREYMGVSCNTRVCVLLSIKYH